MESQDIAHIIKTLVGLQSSDNELIKAKKERLVVAKRIEDGAGIRELGQKLEDAKKETLNAKLKLAQVQSDVSTLLEENEKLEKRLYDGTITNTRELKSVESEQAELRRRIAREEEKITPYESDIAACEHTQAEVETQLKDARSQWAEDEPQYQSQIVEHNQRIKNLFDERKKITAQMPSYYVKTYENLFKQTKGMAVVQVNRGVCMGCFIQLPLNETNKLKKDKNLPRCSNCARILIFD